MVYNFSNFDKKLSEAKDWFLRELSSIRTGRANPALVKGITVDYYGSKTPLEGLASVGVEDAKTLIINPWDKETILPIEKAIRSSNLGLQPVVDKEIIRIILPELTGERRQQMIKLVGEKAEIARVSARRERDEAWKEIQDAEKKGEITEDEKFRHKDELQKKTDAFNKEIEETSERKKKEIMGQG